MDREELKAAWLAGKIALTRRGTCPVCGDDFVAPRPARCCQKTTCRKAMDWVRNSECQKRYEARRIEAGEPARGRLRYGAQPFVSYTPSDFSTAPYSPRTSLADGDDLRPWTVRDGEYVRGADLGWGY